MSLIATSDWCASLRTLRTRYPCRTVMALGRVWRIRDTTGRGKPLILLPGALGNADIFHHQMTALAPRVRCIAVDYPDAAEDELADGLAQIMDTLRLERFSTRILARRILAPVVHSKAPWKGCRPHSREHLLRFPGFA